MERCKRMNLKVRLWNMMNQKRRTMFPSPWSRDFPGESLSYKLEQLKFPSRCYQNRYLDITTKRVAIKASASVVSLVTFSDEKEIFQGTGTIIDKDGTILTSAKLVTCPTGENVVANNLKVTVYLWDGKSYEAKLLACDFYYGIAVVKIKPNDTQLKPACLTPVDDCVPLELPVHGDNTDWQLRPHSNAYKLVPGNKVIALGRCFFKPYDLMAAPGEFSIERDHREYECRELLRATCLITTIGIGGPLINHHGGVIGVASYYLDFSPFLPINLVLKWLEHWKQPRSPRQPFIGMELANLYTADIVLMEMFNQKFPDKVAGVIVETVEQGSSADDAGIHQHDVIVGCCGKTVRSFLELYDMMWDKTGDSVVLAVLRASHGAELDLTMEVVNAIHSNKRKKTKKGGGKSKKRTRS